MTSKRVAVIGAGASGLTAIKACLDEELIPVCFERTGDIGGLWRYTDDPIEGQGCVMKSTIINTSKEMMSYSDFPIPESFPVFMHNSLVYKYFEMYAVRFDLKKYISYHEEVVYVQKTDDFPETGRWEIKHKNLKTGEEAVDVFDGVLVCTGHHADKYIPTFPGLNGFSGEVVHTHDYRIPDGIEGKKVLVVGIGNSGGDVAVELSRLSKQVILSTRRGSWILNRVYDHGYPVDMILLTRPFNFLQKHVPALVNLYQQWHAEKRIDHKLYSLRPAHKFFEQHPMVNDDMPNRIICGTIKVKTDIKRFTSTGAEFVDGTIEENIDLVIMATGYSFGFPFIDKEVIDVQENHVQLFKYMYPPNLGQNTLAVIGCFQPVGAIMPISEMQCRLATRVINGRCSLPSQGEMWNDVRRKAATMAQRYTKSRRHTIQVDYVPFMDELAQLVGCSVDILDLLRRDPRLAIKVLFGPVTPYTYRLYGPGNWVGARGAIMTQWNRTKAPLQTRPVPPVQRSGFAYIQAGIFLLLLYFLFCFLFC